MGFLAGRAIGFGLERLAHAGCRCFVMPCPCSARNGTRCPGGFAKNLLKGVLADTLVGNHGLAVQGFVEKSLFFHSVRQAHTGSP